jgi:two-component system cell cycle response regulator
MANKTGTNILVVDDTPENAILLSRILKMSGYKVEIADNGSRAIELARIIPFDMILLDISMPGIDGFEACSRLKQDERTRDIPVIFISGLSAPEEKVKAFRVGGVDYIDKPFDIEEVQARVETHLVLRQLRRQLEEMNNTLAMRVDELSRSQQLLAERERKLRAFVTALPNPAFVFNEQGQYLEVFTVDTTLLLVEPNELLGKFIEDVLPPKESAMILDAIRQTIEMENIQIIEYKVPIVAGKEHWFEGRLACMEKDQYGHGKVVMIISDITERVHLYKEVQRLADQDVLTSCVSRRHFMALAAQEIERSISFSRSLSLLMIDIDHYKSVNDQFGHQIGDQLLRNLVNLCQKQLRPVDILGRYGGDEFVALLPDTTGNDAMSIAERLRKKIENTQLELPEGKFSTTVSIGLTSLERGGNETQTLDMLVKRADQALYAAKAAGRNCCVRA